MLRKTMIVLATATALTAGLTADAFARGGGGGGHMGGGHMGGGFGHIGGSFGGIHMGGGLSGGIAGQHFAGMSGHFGHGRRIRIGSGPGVLYDYECNYDYPYYNPDNYNCYPPEY